VMSTRNAVNQGDQSVALDGASGNFRSAASAEQSHQLNSIAQFAAILNQVALFRVRRDLLKFHRYLTHDAGKEIDERALIVVCTAHGLAFMLGSTWDGFVWAISITIT